MSDRFTTLDSLNNAAALNKFSVEIVHGFNDGLPLDSTIESTQRPAYLYLVDTYLAYKQKTASSTTQSDCKKELQEKLLPGLKRYFDEANNHQNTLIDFTVNSARETLLAEALYLRMNLLQGTMFTKTGLEKLFQISLPDAAKESNKALLRELIQDTLDTMLPDANSAPFRLPPIEDPLYQDLLDAIELQQGAHGKAKAEAGLALREKISHCLQKLALPEIHIKAPALRAFDAARKTQTEAFNAYDSLLKEKRETLLKEADTIDYRDPNPKRTKLEYVIELLNERIDDAEAFRNGYIDVLPPQSPEFTNLVKIVDLSTEFRDSTKLKHPLFSQLSVLQKALNNIAPNAKNTYKDSVPNLNVSENGIKSWRRTIDKLIHEKGSEWSQMKDMARINIVCDRPETAFYFNQAMQRRANTEKWTPDTLNTIKITNTGALNWLSKYIIPTEDGQGWGVEIKFDDRKQREVEYYTHKIFECIRLIGTKPKELDAATLELNFPRFIKQTDRYIGLLEKFNPYPASEGIKKQINAILETTKEPASNTMSLSSVIPASRALAIKGLRPKLQALHASLCCEAAKSSSLGMAALYTSVMEDKLRKLGATSEDADPATQKEEEKISDLLIKALRDHGPTNIPEQHKEAVQVLLESIGHNTPPKQEKTR